MDIQHYQVPLLVEDMDKLMKATKKKSHKEALTAAVVFTIKKLGE